MVSPSVKIGRKRLTKECLENWNAQFDLNRDQAKTPHSV
jgi:hypothetical protein